MTNFKKLKPFMERPIEDWGGVVSDDYKSFQRKYKNFLKELCNNNGYKLIDFNPNHYCFSCFIKGNDKYIYISISDVRYFSKAWFNNILIRTAKNEKDYTGGHNNYTSISELETMIQNMLRG